MTKTYRIKNSNVDIEPHEVFLDKLAHHEEEKLGLSEKKFEVGLDSSGTLLLIDEVLTPDSSRFWPLDQYQPGQGQPSFDKQFLRDYLSSLDWNKQPPPPAVPAEILEKTKARYLEAQQILTR